MAARAGEAFPDLLAPATGGGDVTAWGHGDDLDRR